MLDPMRWSSGSAVAGVLALLALSAGAGPASAHSDLVASFPVADDRVDELPHQVVLEFDEPMQLAADGVVLRGPSGRPFPADVLTAGGGDVFVAVPSPEQAPPAGRWVAEYAVVSLDGHVATGAVTFWVGATGALMPAGDGGALARSLALLLVLLAAGFALLVRMLQVAVPAR